MAAARDRRDHCAVFGVGIMFPDEAQYDGKRLDKTYVKQRIAWEPLYEITQIKGDGETHPFLSPNDSAITLRALSAGLHSGSTCSIRRDGI